MFSQKDGKLFYSFDNQTVCIEAWGPNALRVRATANREFTDNDWALTETIEKGSPDIDIHVAKLDANLIETLMGSVDKETYAKITNGKITACFNGQGVLSFINDKGEILLKENWRRLDDSPSMSLKYEGREFLPEEGENYKITLRFLANDDEKIFGMGQYQQPYLDQKGCIVELSQRNSQSSVPFMISNRGYGMLWNNPAIGHATFGKNLTEWVAEPQNRWTTGSSRATVRRKLKKPTQKSPEPFR